MYEKLGLAGVVSVATSAYDASDGPFAHSSTSLTPDRSSVAVYVTVTGPAFAKAGALAEELGFDVS